MYALRVRLAMLAGLALLAGCEPAPADDFSMGRARESFDDGDLDSALRYTELAMQRAPYDARSDEIALHLEILRSAGRTEEARALEEFVARFEAGENTDSEETQPTRTECNRMERARPKSMQLVRKYGDAFERRPFAFGNSTATYQIDASGNPVNIRVVRARHPAAAWLAIHAIGELEVWGSRLEKLDPSVFPVDYCVSLVDEVPVLIPFM